MRSSVLLAACAVAALLGSAVPVSPVAAQDAQKPAAQPEPAYVARGHRTEEQQHALTARLETLHDSLEATLRTAAPDLLPQLEPPPSPVPGYQVLPRLVPDAVPGPPGKAQVVSYYWGWSDKLMAGQTAALADIESALAQAPALPAADRHARYEELARKYRGVVDSRRMIDSDINYNWHWQEAIYKDRSTFDYLQKVQEAAVERDRLEAALAADDEAGLRATLKGAATLAQDGLDALKAAARTRIDVLTQEVNASHGFAAGREFLEFTQPSPDEWLATLRFYTDIQDRKFVEAFRKGMEDRWSADEVQDGRTTRFRMRVIVTTLTPAQLYCSDAKLRRRCTPPKKGAPIDVDAHVAKFPTDGGVLTTGAGTLRFVGLGGIVLSASDVSLHVLAHEFGHTLGFPDAYFRGYADMGAEGFRITEFGAPGDIMSAPGAGPILARHFRVLLGTKAQEWLNRSLALYRERKYEDSLDAARRAVHFRPDYALAHNNVAAACASLGRWDDAIAAATEALRLDPAFQMARNNLAWAQGEKAKGQVR